MRIVGLETELALGFQPEDLASGQRPSQEDLFQAVLRALKTTHASCEAVYYKGGEFLQNGSLIHFEVSRLDDPRIGLLEWATPECLGAVEAATYCKAQERALLAALEEAERDLASQGHTGRLLLLKNNEDRYGNAYGCHESYDVVERERTWTVRLLAATLHPLVLFVILTAALVLATPLLAVFCVLGVVFVTVQMIGAFPGLGWLSAWLQRLLKGLMEFLVEAGPTPGSGLVAHLSLAFLRAGGVLFSLTGRHVIFPGHLAPLLPFLVTRPIFGGAGILGADGRYRLTPRARLMRSEVAAFIYGNWRPLIDIKEYFYRRPLAYWSEHKRLHILAGDSSRSEYAELLKLATTEAVLDAIEAGALDELARRIVLEGGAVAAFRRVANDPSLATTVARDRETGAALTAIDVQRRVLEAVWAHFRAQPEVSPEVKDALVRWDFVLDRLADDPRTLDRELDWVIKLRLLSAALTEELGSEGWATLAAWGPVNVLLEQVAPHVQLSGEPTAAAVRASLRAALGWRRARRADAHVRRADLEWEAFPAVRRAYLRLKTIDLKYHELSRDGGYYDWLARDGAVARVLDPLRVERACSEPPLRTRATIRGRAVKRYAGEEGPKVRVGWDKLVFDEGEGEPRVVRLDDPYQHELEGEDL